MTSITPGYIETHNNVKYTFIKLLGEGGYGQVWKCKLNNTEQYVAIKIYGFITDDYTFEIRNLQHIKAFCSKYAVCILDHYLINNQPRIVLEYIKGPNLAQFYKLYPINVRINNNQIINDLTNGLIKFFTNNITHQDIKEANIMYDSDKKIFRYLDWNAGCIKSNAVNRPCFFIGTLYTAPPEIVNWYTRTNELDGNYYKVMYKTFNNLISHDLWSLGVVLYNYYSSTGDNFDYVNNMYLYSQSMIYNLINNLRINTNIKNFLKILLQRNFIKRILKWNILLTEHNITNKGESFSNWLLNNDFYYNTEYEDILNDDIDRDIDDIISTDYKKKIVDKYIRSVNNNLINSASEPYKLDSYNLNKNILAKYNYYLNKINSLDRQHNIDKNIIDELRRRCGESNLDEPQLINSLSPSIDLPERPPQNDLPERPAQNDLPPIQRELTQRQPTRSELTQMELTQIQPIRRQPTRSELTQMELTQIQPTQIQPTQMELTQLQPIQNELTQMELTRLQTPIESDNINQSEFNITNSQSPYRSQRMHISNTPIEKVVQIIGYELHKNINLYNTNSYYRDAYNAGLASTVNMYINPTNIYEQGFNDGYLDKFEDRVNQGICSNIDPSKEYYIIKLRNNENVCIANNELNLIQKIEENIYKLPTDQIVKIFLPL
jgi:serine/threonine protein kinase